jgi:hypothetical protein
MAEEVKIIVKEERSGDALRQAEEDLRKLEDRQKRLATREKTFRDKGATGQAEAVGTERQEVEKEISRKQAKIKAETAAQAKATKQAIASTKLEEEQARAGGRKAEADALAKEVKELQTALDLQTKLGIGQDEALKLAKESVSAKGRIAQQTAAEAAAAREATRQKKEQDALDKAGIRSPRRALTNLGIHLAQGNASPQAVGQMGGTLLAGAAGVGVAGAAIAAAVAAAAVAVTDSFFTNREKDISLKNRVEESRSRDSRSLRSLGGIFGSAGQAVQAGLNTSEEINERTAHREELKRKAKFGWYNPLRWSDKMFGTTFQTKGMGWWKPDGARAIEENEIEIERLKARREEEYQTQRKKFEEEGALELKIARARARHDLPGLRESRLHESTLSFAREYKRMITAGANPDEAKESAEITVSEQQREWMMRNASLVNARSGAGDTARAAMIAMGSVPDQAELRRSVDEMHTTLKGQLGQLNEHTSRATFPQ